MEKTLAFFGGLGLGAGLMYLFDPDRGRRRRALVRDQGVHAAHEAQDALRTAGRDVRNRARGLAAETGAWLHGGERPGRGLDLFQRTWAPGTRALVALTGGGLFAYGLTRRAPWACFAGTAGLALAARSLSRRGLGHLLEGHGGRHFIEVHKTLTIAGPVGRVFPFFAGYQNFPRFMTHVREVRDLGGGRSHWVAAGPAGTSVSWDAHTIGFEPNRLLAWRSEPGSAVPNTGVIRFEPTPGGDTRVDIRLRYRTLGGVLGHWAARLFGADPASSMDEDLERLKTLIQEGSTRVPGKGEVARQDVAPAAGPAR
jgi:uncharacterized membrane protein